MTALNRRTKKAKDIQPARPPRTTSLQATAGRHDTHRLASGAVRLIDWEDRLQPKTRAVVVMPRGRWSQILNELDAIDVEVICAENCQQARGLLQKKPRVELVLSDLSLTDGNWCDVFRHLIDNDIHASMVVMAPQADERLWSEVLWRGAYDLLVAPYEAGDVKRVVEGALRAAKATRPVAPVPAGSVVLPVETAVAAS